MIVYPRQSPHVLSYLKLRTTLFVYTNKTKTPYLATSNKASVRYNEAPSMPMRKTQFLLSFTGFSLRKLGSVQLTKSEKPTPKNVGKNSFL